MACFGMQKNILCWEIKLFFMLDTQHSPYFSDAEKESLAEVRLRLVSLTTHGNALMMMPQDSRLTLQRQSGVDACSV